MDSVPAFTMWKTFSDTMSALQKVELSEHAVLRLVQIVKSHECSNIFVYERDSSVSYVECKRIVDKYTTFTMWLIGRFFHLLSCPKLERCHQSVVEAQVCVLDKLSRTQTQMYRELANEFASVLHQIVTLHESTTKKPILLTVFHQNAAEDCTLSHHLDLTYNPIEVDQETYPVLLGHLLRIIAFILQESFSLSSASIDTTACIVDDLLSLLQNSTVDMKMDVTEVLIKLLPIYNVARSSLFQYGFDRRIQQLYDYVEQITLYIYNTAWLDRQIQARFDSLIIDLLKLSDCWKPLEKISLFFTEQTLRPNCSQPSIEIQAAFVDVVQSLSTPKWYIENIECNLKRAIWSTSLLAVHIIKSSLLDVNGEILWMKITTVLMDYLHDATIPINNYLTFFNYLINLLLQIGIVHSKWYRFKDGTIITQLLEKIDDTTDVDMFHKIILNFQIVCEQQFNSLDILNDCRLHLGPVRRAKCFLQYVEHLSMGLNVTHMNLNGLFETYLKLSIEILTDINYTGDLQQSVVYSLPQTVILFNQSDMILSKIYTPILGLDSRTLNISNPTVAIWALEILPQLICLLTSQMIRQLKWNQTECRLECKLLCEKCNVDCIEGERIGTLNQHDVAERLIDIVYHIDSLLPGDSLHPTYLPRNMSKQAILAALPSCTKHLPRFRNNVRLARNWMSLLADSSETIRRSVVNICATAIGNYLEGSKSTNMLEEVFHEYLLEITKKLVMKQLNYEIQETVLHIIEELLVFPSSATLVITLIYLIMMATSKYQFIAVHHLLQLVTQQKHPPIFKQHRQIICKTIANLCCLNRAILRISNNRNSLQISLTKLAQTFGYINARNFVQRESHHLLPYFVRKICHISEDTVRLVLEEMAVMCDTQLEELLAKKYGTIFLYCLLEESRDEFDKCMQFVETTTKLSGSVLRKRNFQTILNDLVVNFHGNQERVLHALNILKSEDARSSVEQSIEEYLKPHLLGLLQHFDFKLMENADNHTAILDSLIGLLTFMGQQYMGVVRLKVIAMLRTASYSTDQYRCHVWMKFIRCCSISDLAPQLATIFVTLLPFLEANPCEVNAIYRYFLVEHIDNTQGYVKDVYFIRNETALNPDIRQVLSRHGGDITCEGDFASQLMALMQYLSHDTVEVRINAFKSVRTLLAQNRHQVDQMILGYNGIAPVIVALIELFATAVARDTNDSHLRLVAANMLGELGAVEPSHMPRRLADCEKCKTLAHTMEDPLFASTALTELLRAIQSEVNTYNMDRFSIAIQEILKHYHIGPDSGTTITPNVWSNFTSSQQELMRPWLTSKYIIKEPVVCQFPCPIYGTNAAATFKSWLYNWTCSCIALLQLEKQQGSKRTLMTDCLPAMRQDYRVLMNFLPYILVHCLIDADGERSRRNSDALFTEMSIVINSYTTKETIPEDVTNNRPFGMDASLSNSLNETVASSNASSIAMKSKQFQCVKVVFVLLDFLERWQRQVQYQQQPPTTANTTLSVGNVQRFLKRFPKLHLAHCNYKCGEYARALLYLEDYMLTTPKGSVAFDEALIFLADIYARLDDADSLTGCMALQTHELPIEQRILALETAGKLSDAAACYECLSQPLKMQHLRGKVQCYLELDNVSTALSLIQNAANQPLLYEDDFLQMQTEPLWRLGRYNDLQQVLKRLNPINVMQSSWGTEIGRILLYYRRMDSVQFQVSVNALKCQQVDCFSAVSVDDGSAYQTGYSYIVRLHILNELETIERTTRVILDRINDTNVIQNAIGKLRREWALRLKIVQESVRTVEPILRVRRVAIEQAKWILEQKGGSTAVTNCFDSLLGECWLRSAKIARKTGLLQQSFTYLLKAESYAPEGLFMEKAKLHWLREEYDQALTTLQRALDTNVLDVPLRAEAKLLIATYNDTISNVDTETNLNNYKECVEIYREWEKSLVALAQFNDRVFQSSTPETRDNLDGSRLQLHMINYFGKSLQYGTEFVYQSMPRLLSIWFDYGTRLLDTDSSSTDERRTFLLQMTKLVDTFLERLPPFMFLTAFSQIVSRICHPQKEVYIELKAIIVKLLLKYPQQSLWMMLAVIKSGYALRSKRCAEIFSDPQLKSASMVKLISDFTSLAERLTELCNKELSCGPRDPKELRVSQLVKALPRLIANADFSQIMLPTHHHRKLILPNPHIDGATGHPQHNPFPNLYVHIVGIDDTVVVLPSLQRPRRIALHGSDGRRYVQLLKARDDLRKDFRLMEFNDIVNQLLSHDADCRQRRLNLRLYSVVPLNEECGMIEWVPNLVGLRPILMKIYQMRCDGLPMKARQLKEVACNIRDSIAKKRDVFVNVLLAKHPPILGEWFRRTFPDPQSWIEARTAYTRTTAAISMVGYILGLGDRHGENILLDETSGDTVHVDFNCLFNKGESFEWPERVPFRLTQNMVAAMGPLGVDGVFRKCCACTLRVLRTNTTTLMSIVTPFVYDPLVSWPRNVPTNVLNTERINEQALEHVRNIELRLQGIIKDRNRSLTVPLSVEGQANHLIAEAMSVDNLCQMYIGWGPFL